MVALLALGVAVSLALPLLSRTEPARRLAERLARDATGLAVAMDGLAVGYDLTVDVRGLTMAVPGTAPFLKARRARVRLDARALRGRVAYARLEGPEIHLDRLPARAAAGGHEAGPAIDVIEVRDAVVRYRAGGRPVVVGPLDTTVDSVRGGEALIVAGQSLVGDGAERPARLRWEAVLDPDLTRVAAKVRVRFARLADAVAPAGDVAWLAALAERPGGATLELDGNPRGTMRLAPSVTVRATGDTLPLAVRGDVALDAAAGTAAVRLTAWTGPQLPAATLGGTVTAGDPPRVDLTATWKDVPVAAVARQMLELPPAVGGTMDLTAHLDGTTAAPALRGALLVRDVTVTDAWYDLGGTVESLQIAGAIGTTAGAYDVDVAVAARGVALHDPTFVTAVEHAALDGSIAGRIGGTDAFELRLDLAAERGEALWRRLYLDLAPHPVRLRGTVARRPGRTRLEAGHLEIGGLGSATVAGTLDERTAARTLVTTVEVPRLAPFFATVVRAPLQESYASLRDATATGALRARLSYRGGPRLPASLSGHVAVADAHVTTRDPRVEVRGLALDLPIALGADATAPVEDGSLVAEDLEVGGVSLGALDVPLVVGPDRVEVPSALRIPVLDGLVVVRDLEARDLSSPARQASLRLALDELALPPLARALGWPRFTGTISGTIPRVRLTQETLETEGAVEIRVFGGGVEARNLRVTELLSPVPTLALDLDFRRISLAKLTDAFEFGRISGVAEGAVHDLAIVDGQPVRFRARLATVAQRGVPQRVSVTAIRQLSILGGSGDDPITRGVLGFFDEYRYAKMGFHCQLENDRFVLRGIERGDDGEYLVVGSRLPPRVNVVSHNQVISFSEMVQRLRHTLAAGAPAPAGEGGDDR